MSAEPIARVQAQIDAPFATVSPFIRPYLQERERAAQHAARYVEKSVAQSSPQPQPVLTPAADVQSPQASQAPLAPVRSLLRARAHSRQQRLALMAPGALRPEYDVAAELFRDAERYRGDCHLKLFVFPDFLRTCLDRVRTQAAYESARGTEPTPGLSPTIACCSMHGVDLLRQHAAVQALLELKDLLDTVRDVDLWLLEQAMQWFRNFRLGVPDPTGCGASAQSVSLPEYGRKAIGNLAAELGIKPGILCVLATTLSLRGQVALLQEQRDLVETSCARALKVIEMRARMAEVLVQITLGE